MPPLGALEAEDVAVLDRLAVKLICLDDRFAPPLTRIGRLCGHRLAGQCHPAPVSLRAARAGSRLTGRGAA